jgi:hypothetical protein
MAIYYSASYIHYLGHSEKKHYSGSDVSSIKEGKNHKLFNCVNIFELFHQPTLGPPTAPKTRLIFIVAIIPSPVKQILYPIYCTCPLPSQLSHWCTKRIIPATLGERLCRAGSAILLSSLLLGN